MLMAFYVPGVYIGSGYYVTQKYSQIYIHANTGIFFSIIFGPNCTHRLHIFSQSTRSLS